MSSDYLLGKLGYNPDASWKRLGDGLYEQRLIREAVVARTGQRYINGLASDDALFRYLMDNAISYKDSLNLQLGVSLTAEQVASLTHDIVWMEEAEVNGQKVYPLTFKLSLVDQVKKGELSYKEAQERYRIQRAELAADVSFEI